MARWQLAVAVLFAMVGGAALLSLSAASAGSEHDGQVLAAVDQYLNTYVNMETGLRGYAATGDAVFLQPYAQARTKLGARYRAVRGYVANDGAELAILGQVHALGSTWQRTWASPVLSTVQRGGRISIARLLAGKAQMDRLRAAATRLRTLVQARAALAQNAIAQRFLEEVLAALAGTGLLVAAAYTASSRLGRAITAELEQIRNGAQRIAEGDLTVRLATGSLPELEALGAAFNVMASRLVLSQRSEMALLREATAARRRLDALIGSGPVGMVMIDASGQVERINARAADILGVPARVGARVGGLGLLHRFVRRLSAESRRDVRTWLSHWADGRADHTRVRLTEGPYRAVDVYSSVVAQEDGTPVARSITLIDRTAEEAAAEAKSHFLAAVSHELRTPLAAIRGYVDLLLDGDAGALNEVQAEFLRTVQRSGVRLGSLVDELLDVERMAAGRLHIEPQRVELGAILAHSVEAFQAAAARAGLSLSMGVETASSEVHGDPARLGQVFDNLLSNAIKYTPSGSIDVRLFRRDDQVVVRVTDTGLGMSDATLARLGEAFLRDPAVRDRPGTGLGLSIVKGLVEAHGGRLAARSEAGKGSTFFVELPAARVLPASSADAATEDDAYALVLWADPTRGAAVLAACEELGLPVRTATDVEGAVAWIEAARPAVVVAVQRLGPDALGSVLSALEDRMPPVVVPIGVVGADGEDRTPGARIASLPQEDAAMREALCRLVAGPPRTCAVLAEGASDRLASAIERLGHAVVRVIRPRDAAAAGVDCLVVQRPTGGRGAVAVSGLCVIEVPTLSHVAALLRAWRAPPAGAPPGGGATNATKRG